ncbi:phosphoheptose isomerase [Pseudoalteromonas sp. MSK9-3]|nr:phosphoheptose isomerase [Pseudoalteromonas sp. MSK9-3]
MDATGSFMTGPRNNLKHLTTTYVNALTETLRQLDTDALSLFVDTLLNMREKRGTLYLCGNGGSAANAIHLANDFTFGINPQGNALKVEALPANSSILSCLGNDIGYDNIFSHQLKVKAEQHDILLVLSGSGNSQNIINAISQANKIGMATVGILGFDGGKAKTLLDQPFHFDIQDMQISEDTQVILGHILMKALYLELKHE